MGIVCRRKAVAATANRQGDGVSLFLKKEELQELISLLSVVCTNAPRLPLCASMDAPPRCGGKGLALARC